MRIKYTLLEDLKEDDKQYICKNLTLRQNSLMKDIILGKVHDNFGIEKYNKKLVSIITDGNQKVGSSLILFNKNKTFIFLLFVPKKYRGKGIGSLLLKGGIRKMQGKSRIGIFIWDKRSYEFYRKYFKVYRKQCLNIVKL